MPQPPFFDPLKNPVSITVLRRLSTKFHTLTTTTDPIIHENLPRLLILIGAVTNFFSQQGGDHDRDFLVQALIDYLVQYGGLLQTREPAPRFVFDSEQFQEIIAAADQNRRPRVPGHTSRLWDLLPRAPLLAHKEGAGGGNSPSHPAGQSPVPPLLVEEGNRGVVASQTGAPPSQVATPPRKVPPAKGGMGGSVEVEVEPVPEPQLSPLENLSTTLEASLSSVPAQYAAITAIIRRELLTFALIIHERDLSQLPACLLSLNEQLTRLISAVEDDTLTVLQMKDPPEKVVEVKVVEREIPVITNEALQTLQATLETQQQLIQTTLAQLAAISKPTFDFASAIAQLETRKRPLASHFEKIRKAEEAAREIESSLTAQIEGDFNERLKYAPDTEKPLAQLLIHEASQRQAALHDYLDAIARQRQPVEDALGQINRYLNALKTCQRGFELPQIDLAPVTETTISDDLDDIALPAPNPELDTTVASDQDTSTPPQAQPDMPPIEKPADFFGQLSLVAFMVCGATPLDKVTSALTSMGILSDTDDQADFALACNQNPGIFPLGFDRFMPREQVGYAPWMDDILSDAQQKQLCQLVHAPPTELTELELLILAALSSFKQLSARQLSHVFSRQGLIKGKQTQEIYSVFSQLKTADQYLLQAGALSGTPVYRIKKGVTIPWQHAILSLRELQNIHEDYERSRIEKQLKLDQ